MRTITDAAKDWQVSRWTVCSWIRCGRFAPGELLRLGPRATMILRRDPPVIDDGRKRNRGRPKKSA